MITYKYKSKAKCIPGVQCLQCNDLETTTAEQELYVVTTAKTRSIRYIGMSRQYWLGRPTKSHNDTYNKYLNKYPNGYIIFRFKCDNAQQLERAGLELVKNANVWNRVWQNGAELTEEAMAIVEAICLTYNLKVTN